MDVLDEVWVDDEALMLVFAWIDAVEDCWERGLVCAEEEDGVGARVEGDGMEGGCDEGAMLLVEGREPEGGSREG